MICKNGIWDSSIPGIKFDDKSESNYSKLFKKMLDYYPRNDSSLSKWKSIVQKVKSDGKKKKYDCIVGISGGTDSTYLLHLLVKEYDLRPLAVTFDNGWSSEIAIQNIKSITSILNIDLETYVVDYEEMKDIMKSYMKAGLPWIDGPTDHAIKALLYKQAKKEGVKYIFHGSDFRSEGFQPNEWTHCDARQIRYINNKFGSKKIKSFPIISLLEEVYFLFFLKIKAFRPYYYLPYEKIKAQEFIKLEYNWKYYGGHHHENSFTKFAIADWLPNKFNIDKRKITLSALVMSGEISRTQALQEINRSPYDSMMIKKDRKFVMKKLDLNLDEFYKIFSSKNMTFYDYPSYFPITTKFSKLVNFFVKYFLPYKPLSLMQNEVRKSQKNE